MKRSAIIEFGDLCRMEIRRVWDDALPLAAWLMLNPSRADAEIDDPTCLRVTHFTRKLGAGGWIGVNVIPYRATDPADMLRALELGTITAEMLRANLDYVANAGREARWHVAAFGVVHRNLGWHRGRALEQFLRRAGQPLCLGASPGGWPLHPLARGKFAIRNDVDLMPWQKP